MKTEVQSAKEIRSSGKPYFIYGCAWKKDETAKLVKDAISSGFRFLDTANQPSQYNEAGVGEGWVSAVEESGGKITREDLFIQTKFSPDHQHDKENVPYNITQPIDSQVKGSFEASLKNLKTSYVDAFILHIPYNSFAKTMTAWTAMESLLEEGKVKKIGISNVYKLDLLEKIYDEVTIKPTILQNRFYRRRNYDTSIRKFCEEKGIIYQAFWTISGNRVSFLRDDYQDLARQKGLTSETLMYAFILSLGHMPLSGTKSRQHMAEDISLWKRYYDGEVLLSNDEIEKMKEYLGMEKDETVE